MRICSTLRTQTHGSKYSINSQPRPRRGLRILQRRILLFTEAQFDGAPAVQDAVIERGNVFGRASRAESPIHAPDLLGVRERADA